MINKWWHWFWSVVYGLLFWLLLNQCSKAQKSEPLLLPVSMSSPINNWEGKGEQLKLRTKNRPTHFTEMRFASLLSGGFITMTVVNPPEMKLAKCPNAKVWNLEEFLNSARFKPEKMKNNARIIIYWNLSSKSKWIQLKTWKIYCYLHMFIFLIFCPVPYNWYGWDTCLCSKSQPW